MELGGRASVLVILQYCVVELKMKYVSLLFEFMDLETIEAWLWSSIG